MPDQNKIVYNDYKRRLNARQLLDHYNAQNVTEVIAADGTTELLHSCLVERCCSHHANGDAHPSASLNVDKKLYCCYSGFWAGDVFHLIMMLEGKESFEGVAPVIGDFLTGATRGTAAFSREIEALLAEPVYSLDLPSYSERVLDPWTKCHPYMLDVRGISRKAHKLLKIGYDDKENRIVFPHFWKDRLVGWQKRAIPEAPDWSGTHPTFPKYRSSSGFPKSETLYGYDDAMELGGFKTVIALESPMSVARACSLGLLKPRALATFGAKVSKHQIDLLKSFDRVFVWFDDDVAGHAGERKLVEGLYRHTDVRVVSPDKDQDLGDLQSTDQILEKIEAAKPAALWLDDQDTP